MGVTWRGRGFGARRASGVPVRAFMASTSAYEAMQVVDYIAANIQIILSQVSNVLLQFGAIQYPFVFLTSTFPF
jgi:hypothetical protein